MSGSMPVAVPAATGWGVHIDGTNLSLHQSEPLSVELAGEPGQIQRHPYDHVDVRDDGFTGCASVVLAENCRLQVEDRWQARHGDATVTRTVHVHGSSDLAFSTGLFLDTNRSERWPSVEPFVPGVAYGHSPRVANRALGGLPARNSGVRTVLVREDRSAAPVFAVRYPTGDWLAILHQDVDGSTIAADGLAENAGDTLVDARLRVASLGGRTSDNGLEFGLSFPGSEGEYSYSSGGLPLLQLDAWRRRYHPAHDGLTQQYELKIRLGSAATTPGFYQDVWRWAWERLDPQVAPADADRVVAESTRVLASQAVTVHGKTGIPLESDAVTSQRSIEDDSAVMGFVGANTDAGYLLLRVADESPPGSSAALEWRRLGERVLDTFAAIPMRPPAAEGFDTRSGAPTTYRTYLEKPAVYARSIAEGGQAMLDAVRWERRRGVERDGWLAWAIEIGDWLCASQAGNGSVPRAWTAGDGVVLDRSSSASYVIVPFLTALAGVTGVTRYLGAAVAAAEFTWADSGVTGAYAGATLDNPNVVDKEAAVLSAEGFLALFEATGDSVWLDRAQSAASIAETWIYLWNVPMPDDGDESLLHWKRGVPTVGHQLIATGVSMTDGFLAVNTSLFARLFEVTGDEHWLAVARLVLHGTTSMLATEGRTFDLRGPGWQQEHWSFAPRRGFGLNRRWLPWVPVAHVRGIHRVQDLSPRTRRLVLGCRGEDE